MAEQRVRVIRLLEYIYADYETAERDMKQWQTPQNGSISFGAHEEIRSSVIIRPEIEIKDD